jgi:uncharacterized protein (TIGR02246 family)
MKRKQLFIGCVLGLLLLLPHRVAWGQDPADSIKQVLAGQVAAWNQGDINGFMSGYENSPETIFVGKSVLRGWAPMAERYRKIYPTKEAMGTLEFSELAVRMLGSDHAIVTGKFHLTRTAAGGGDADGIFSLVFEKAADGWKIILDHTS